MNVRSLWVFFFLSFLLHLPSPTTPAAFWNHDVLWRCYPLSQIEKDLLRTMPTNACFSSLTSVGVPRLRRVLRGLAWLYPDIGYCQGTGMVRTHVYRITKNKNMSSASWLNTHTHTHILHILMFCFCPSYVFHLHCPPTGGFLPPALSWGGGCAMDDVCPDRRPPSAVLLLFHSVGRTDGPEGSPPAHCSVPASPRPPSAGAWHR